MYNPITESVVTICIFYRFNCKVIREPGKREYSENSIVAASEEMIDAPIDFKGTTKREARFVKRCQVRRAFSIKKNPLSRVFEKRCSVSIFP